MSVHAKPKEYRRAATHGLPLRLHRGGSPSLPEKHPGKHDRGLRPPRDDLKAGPAALVGTASNGPTALPTQRIAVLLAPLQRPVLQLRLMLSRLPQDDTELFPVMRCLQVAIAYTRETVGTAMGGQSALLTRRMAVLLALLQRPVQSLLLLLQLRLLLSRLTQADTELHLATRCLQIAMP